ncbi:uncharacterized protein TRUGW13939_03663 [Talaromyces rugulosus]|uniref:Uncharacterized protein n=1 Tax=Talaromyces rugulosus TaxID=121627 RepID=A0A7H8QRU5_TALRU|nr:uncharacterized protein TRUGW13939_03663 [Talaromyces rugulosus]QKX56558.1 hypothetical protein TRUGW13939_03663 [Talaromyces rugulosus]
MQVGCKAEKKRKNNVIAIAIRGKGFGSFARAAAWWPMNAAHAARREYNLVNHRPRSLADPGFSMTLMRALHWNIAAVLALKELSPGDGRNEGAGSTQSTAAGQKMRMTWRASESSRKVQQRQSSRPRAHTAAHVLLSASVSVPLPYRIVPVTGCVAAVARALAAKWPAQTDKTDSRLPALSASSCLARRIASRRIAFALAPYVAAKQNDPRVSQNINQKKSRIRDVSPFFAVLHPTTIFIAFSIAFFVSHLPFRLIASP